MMTKKLPLYAGLTIVFVAAYMLASVLPTSTILSNVAGNIGIATLIGALFTLFRDNAAHERQLISARDDQQFQIGVTSHMSNLVFDKHVVFCEEYMAEVRATVDTLIRNHATADAIGHANNLANIRRNHSTWVTVSMSLRLSRFEDAIRKMGAQAYFVDATCESPEYAEQRVKAIEFVYSEFERILPQLINK
jgi:uncharacterized protein YqfB (UPF0267 family)